MTEVINFESIAKNYKFAVAAKYRPLKPGEISSLPQGDIYVSKKIDGELWLAYIDKEGAKLFAKGGRFINEGEIIESLLKKTKFSKNEVKTIGIRPESIRIVTDGEGEIDAVLETIQPTGADWIVELVVSGKSIFAISSDQPKSDIGQKVRLSFKLDELHVFDDQDLNLKLI